MMHIKVCIVTKSVSSSGGGITTVLEPVCRNLATRHVIDVIGLSDTGERSIPSVWGNASVNVYGTQRPVSLGRSTDARKHLVDSDADLFHSHGIWMHLSSDVYHAAKKRGVPYVVSPHGMLDPWAVRHARFKKWIASMWFEKKHLQHAFCLHALCQAEADSIRDYGLRQPICVIPNAIDLSTDGLGDGIESKPNERKQLLFLGRIHEKKGLIPLVEAWSELGNQSQDWEVVIAGWADGPHQAEVESLVSQKGLAKQIRFTGPVFGDEKTALLRQADAFVLPSFSEGLPMTILEAWSHSLPVVMTDECHLPAGFESDAAIRIEPESESIRGGLESLFSLSDAERFEMGNRGKTLVQTSFTWKVIVNQYVQMYEWMLGGKTPAFVQTA